MAPTTSAWGVGSSARSCDALLHRIEINDPTLTELIILPIKSFGPKDLLRLIQCLDHGEQQGQQSLPPPLQYQINTTATAITLNTHLKSLQASGHAMNDVSVLEAFGRVLTKNPSSCPLVDIAIGDNTLGDEGMEALCRGLLSSSSSSQQQQQYQSSILADDERGRTITTTSPSTRLRLESIDFSWKGIGPQGLTAILRTFGDQESLFSINMSRNDNIGPSFDFGTTATTALSVQYPIFRFVRNLDLSECQLNAKSCTTLLLAMNHPMPCAHGSEKQPSSDSQIQQRHLVLNLNSNDLNDIDNLQEMTRLIVEGPIVVSELCISKCNIGDSGLKVMTDQFVRKDLPRVGCSNDQKLKKLDLSYNDLSPMGIEYLASAMNSYLPDMVVADPFHALCNLHTLNLSGNSLDDQSCVALATTISANQFPGLTELDISKTICGVFGAQALLCSSVGTALVSLNLFGNQLGSDGFVQLSKVIRKRRCYSSLHVLDLGGNDASEAGVVSLLQAFLINEEDREQKEEDEEKASFETKRKCMLRLLVVGGNQGGPTVERVVEEIKTIHPELDIARDKLRRNGDSGNNPMETLGTAWMS